MTGAPPPPEAENTQASGDAENRAARWQTVRHILDTLDDTPEAEREARLRTLCVDATGQPDPALLADIRAVLDAEGEADAADFLASGAAERAAHLLREDPGAVGQRVGPWEITGLLGEGGMGVVYRSRRADGAYEQEAALKLIGRGLAPPSLVERFRRERQILAGFQHPHIARLLDGGLSDAGQPYFAMELVNGEPITAYAYARGLGTEARVRLVRQVADAVAYAHRRLVVHRDLKPSNILVASGEAREWESGTGDWQKGTPPTAPEASGGGQNPLRPQSSKPSPRAEGARVKLLDFGIAKLLDAESEATRTHAPLTPEYAAPEQVVGGEITTATDVYALGALLYELLAGRRAYDTAALGPAATERALDTLPPPPSASGARAVPRDLDAIVLKALSPEAERRYVSADALGADLDRWLDGLPVEARRPTAAYRLGRFVRRHPLGVASGAAFLALLVGFSAVTAVQARRLEVERDRAQLEAATADQVSGFMSDLFVEADPYSSQGTPLSVREILEKGPDLVVERLNGQPEVQAAMLVRIGQAFIHLGQYARADTVLRRSVALHDSVYGRENVRTAEAVKTRAHALSYAGDAEEAEALYRESLRIFRASPEAIPASIPYTLRNVAQTRAAQGDPAEAEALLREALPLARQSLTGEEARNLGIFYYSLGDALRDQARYDEAEPLFRDAVARYREIDPGGLDLAYALAYHARLHHELGADREAVRLYREAIAIGDVHSAPDDPILANHRSRLAVALLALGETPEAERLLLGALDVLQPLGMEHRYTQAALAGLADVYAQTGQPAREAQYRRLLVPAE